MTEAKREVRSIFAHSCRFEQNVLVTGIFFRAALGNQFLGGGQTLVAGICSKYSTVKGQHKVSADLLVFFAYI